MKPSVRDHLRLVDALLEAHYGRPERPAGGPVLDGLIATLLSQNTTGGNARLAFARLKERFPTWDDVLAATVDQVADAIRPAGLAPTRAPRLQAILRRVLADQGELGLEALREWDNDRVRRYLTGYDGVGVKTAACVLLFTLGRAEFPVDTHVHRLARRLGWIDQRTGPEAAFEHLDAAVPDDRKHALHVNLIRHGRRLCLARRPRCGECPLAELCPSAEHPTR